MAVLFVDIEVYHGFFYLGIKRQSDGIRVGFEISRRQDTFDADRVRKILLRNTIVTFNGQGYDTPLIFYALDMVEQGLSQAEINANLKRASDKIINERIRWWEVERALGVRLPRALDHIDLIEPQPNAIASLKTLNGRLHGARMQDLPFDPAMWPTFEDMEVLADYCLTSDLDGTENLFNSLKEPLELRVALGEEYGEDFRSKSDSQIGETIVKKRIEQLTGDRPQKSPTPEGTEFKYPVPAFVRFESPHLNEMLQRIRETTFTVKKDGKVDLPKWLEKSKIPIGSSVYAMGIGGLHSTEQNRAVHADDDYALVDADVASMYPAIILMMGLYPAALGKHFLEVYQRIKTDRLAAKERAKVIKSLLKTDIDAATRAALGLELKACVVKDKGLKISLNGVYGKLGSQYSILHAPHLLISTTLTGQLALLMLIERAVLAGIDVVSANTDGVLFRCPRDWYAGIEKDRLHDCELAEITAQWERDTGLDLEFAEYRSLYSQSVNSYFAIKESGGHKRKGPIANPWSTHLDDLDFRGQLMKNPQATICSDAALAFIKYGTPVEDTVHAATDVRQFVTVIKSTDGATWRDEYLGKTVRYYWSIDGCEILKAKPNAQGTHAKVPKTDGSAPCMTLPEGLPPDIDYARYVAEAREILMDIGAIERPAPPPRPPRLTKANTVPTLLAWALA